MTPWPQVPGLKWAVLSAYARLVPPGPQRSAARLLAALDHPGIGHQGPALVAAVELGLLHKGRPTPEGVQHAKFLLSQKRAMLRPGPIYGGQVCKSL